MNFKNRDLCRRLRIVPFLTSTVLLLYACQQESAVWLEPGSNATHVVLLIGRYRGDPSGSASVTSVDVTTCTDTDRVHAYHYWGIIRGGNDIPIHRVEYGIPPKGFGEHHPALPLSPGCYHVRISGTGRLRFVVSSEGRVSEVDN